MNKRFVNLNCNSVDSVFFMFINLLINNNKTKFKMLYKGKNISSWHAWVISPSNIMASYRKSYVRSTQVLTKLMVALFIQR